MTPNDVKIVADNIDDFIEVPDGVSRLRNAVLTLAVSGKLVPQDKKDGTGEELFQQIQIDRLDKKASTGGRKKKPSDSSAPSIELPFELPDSWYKARLGDITYQITDGTHFTPKYIHTGIPFISIKDISGGSLDFSNTKFISPEEHADLIKRCDPKLNDILICRIGTLGRAALVDTKTPFSIFVSVGLIKYPTSKILPLYLLNVLNSPCLYTQYDQIKAGGSHTNKLNLKEMPRLIVPLPPLAEQARIVKKVEELMKQLDELEVRKREHDETRTRLARSAMQSLGKGESKIAFEHLTELVQTPADLKELEGALLTLAVSGKLLSQDKKEGTAEQLYAQIQSKIGSWTKGRKKKTSEPSSINTEEIPFRIPKSWKWVRLIEIGKLDTGKTPRTGVTGNYAGNIPFIGPGDVQNGKINSYSKLITKQGASESKYLLPGDILMVCIGGTIGKTALVSDTHTFNQQINKITPCLVDSTFLFCVFQSGYFQKLVWSKASGGATPLVNLTRWSSCVVPLPPLAEQKRIVKKVEEVVSLVNKLKPLIGERK